MSRERQAIEIDSAARQGVKTKNGVEQRRLTGPGRSNDSDQFSG